MKGCRPVSFGEFQRIMRQLEKSCSVPVAKRNRCLFTVMLATGLRACEAYRLRIRDVYQHGNVLPAMTLQKRYSKCKQTSTIIPLNQSAQEALREWIGWSGAWQQSPDTWLFPPSVSPRGSEADYAWGRHIKYNAIRKVLAKILEECRISQNVASHSFRKTFAKTMYLALDKDILATQHAMRHASVTSTLAYLAVNEDRVQRAISKGDQHFKRFKW